MSMKEVIYTIIGSGAILGFLQFLIQFLVTRADMKKNIATRIDNVANDVSKLSDRLEEHKATLARTHILRFADELHNGTVHSDEYFRQQILDIDTYNTYCELHPEFANGLTRLASEYIREEYRRQYLHND